MISLMAIAAGGALGAVMRHLFNGGAGALLGGGFPWGIMAVNVLGSLLMGILTGIFALSGAWPQEVRAFLTVGMLGGFTTFSAFSLDTALLIERGAWGAAGFYAAGSVLLSVAALFAGLWIIRAVSA